MPSLKYDDPSGLGFTSPVQSGPAHVRFPFANSPSADVYARVIERNFVVRADYFGSTRRIASRTSYTNLLTYSDDFLTTWNANNSAPSAAARANPSDGAVTMSKVLETVSNTVHGPRHAYTFATATYCFSAILSPGLGRDWVALWLDDGTDVHHCFFNLTTGQKGTATDCTGDMLPLGDGSYRCWIICPATAGAGYVYLLSATDNGAAYTTFAGDTAKGFYGWRAQLEAATTVGPDVFTLNTSRTVYFPDVDYFSQPAADLADHFSYLIAESDPAPTGIAGLVSYTRTSARLPAQQTVYGGLIIDRPVMHAIKSGSTYAVSFDNGVTSNVFPSRINVTAQAGGGFATITETAHGRTVGTRMALWLNDTYFGSGPIYNVVSADSYYIQIENTDTMSSTASAYVAAATAATARYVNGPTSGPVAVKRVSDFYLPGVTPYISTPVDIPVIATKLDPVSWLGEIVAATAYVTVAGTPVERWLDGIIYYQTTISVQMSDALETVSVTA